MEANFKKARYLVRLLALMEKNNSINKFGKIIGFHNVDKLKLSIARHIIESNISIDEVLSSLHDDERIFVAYLSPYIKKLQG